METEKLSPGQLERTTCPCPDPHELSSRPPFLFRTCVNVIRPSVHRSSKWYLSGFLANIRYAFLFSHMLRQSHSAYLITLFKFNSDSNRNGYYEYFLGSKGDRCVGLTTLPPSYVDCLEVWEPQPPGTLRAFPNLDTDCFIFTVYGQSWLGKAGTVKGLRTYKVEQDMK